MEVEIKAEGFSELMSELDALCTPAVQKKLLQNAVKLAAKPVKEDAERRLGKGPGYLTTGTPRKKGWGASTIAAIGIGPVAKHWEVVFQEYGTSGHKVVAGTGKKGTSGAKALAFWWGNTLFFRKSVQIPPIIAKPFMRPALDAKKNEAIDRMRKYLQLVLDAFIDHKQKTLGEVHD